MNRNFFGYYFGIITKPNSTFAELFEDTRKLKYSLLALLIPAVGYALFYMMAYNAGGSPSTFKPWLALPIEHYFKYDIYLSLPAYYLSWASASVTIFLLSKIFNSSVSFENSAATVGFGIGIATWSSMLHDLSDAVLSVLGVINMQEYELLLNQDTFWRYLLLTLYVLYLFWFIALFSIGVQKTNKFSWWKSITIGVIGFAVFQTVLLIFIR